MRRIKGMSGILVTGVAAFAQMVNLSGTVKDGDGDPIAGASVALVSDTSMKDVTNAGGEFSISNIATIRRGSAGGIPIQNSNSVAIKGNQLRFSIASHADKGAVSILSGNGKRCAAIPLGKMESGMHRHTLPELAPGFYVLHIAIDRFSTTLKLVAAGNGVFMAGSFYGEKNVSGISRIDAAVFADTLVVEKEGFKTVEKAISSYQQAGIAIVMKPESDTGSPLPPITDYSKEGPFKTTVVSNSGPAGKHMIIRPEPLGENGFLHAPIIFGPGINSQISMYTKLLTNFASHGFVVVGCNTLTGGPNDPGNNAAMLDGLNWILDQNSKQGSIYKGKLAVDRAVTMGYSVGGTAAVDIGGHAAVATVVSIHGHISNAKLHGTLLQTTGTKDNVGRPMQQQTFDKSQVQTFLGTVTGADHGYIMQNNGGAQRPAIVAWLRYWIYNDTGARHYFYGDDCVLCTAPWENPQRKNWK
jgi:dienelactone hydrolase